MNNPRPVPAEKARKISAPLRLRYLVETAVFFCIIGFFRLFDVDRASRIGGWIGRKLMAPTSLSERARPNLTKAFPEKSEAEIARIIEGMWDNLGRVIAEYAHLDKISSKGHDPRIAIEGIEHLKDAQARGKGIILVSGHFANWEVIPFGGRDLGLVGGQVYRPPNNPYVDRWLYQVRARKGMAEMITKGARGTRRIFSLLRRHECVCMVVDQRTGEGVPAPFFGRDAMTTPVPAALALKLGAAVLPVSNVRTGGAHFRTRVYPMLEPPNTGDPDRDLLLFTAAINAFIEARVRECPEQWLWIHKRWDEKGAPLRKRAQALSPQALSSQTLSPVRGEATTSATSKRV